MNKHLLLTLITISSVLADFSLAENIIKLYPKINTEDQTIIPASVPIKMLQNFMQHPTVIQKKDLISAPYIMGNAKQNLMYSIGDRIYAIGTNQPGRYIIYRINKDIIDPETNKVLGKEIIYNGEAKTIGPKRSANTIVKNATEEKYLPENERFSGTRIFGLKTPSLVKIPTQVAQPLVITAVISEISQGDNLLLVPEDSKERFNFTPHFPTQEISARIVHIFDSSFKQMNIGKYQTVLLNKGLKDGLKNGAVLTIYQKSPNKFWVDVSKRGYKVTAKNYAFPVNQVGRVIVYNTTDDLAYALVFEATDNAFIKIGNIVSNAGKDLEDIPVYEPAD